MQIKTGICIDCTGGKNVPLIAKRCKAHYWQYRAQLKPKQAVKKPIKAITQVSAKRAQESKLYAAKRALFLAERKQCEAFMLKIHSDCQIYATDVHHKRGRAGSNYLDETTWVALCRNCHRWAEENPAKAKEYGLSDSRLVK